MLDGSYIFYFRDMLETVLDCLRTAVKVDLVGAELERNADGERMRSHTMNSDLYLTEQADVRRIHGSEARVAGVMLHLDEAVVAWNGATYVYPVRMLPVNVRGG